VSNNGKFNSKLSTYAKIMLALCYQTHNSNVPHADKKNEIIDELLQELVDEIRVQGRTAYLSYSSGSPHPLPLSTQALALNALVNGPVKFSGLSLTEKLANYVSGQTPAQSVSTSADFSGYGVRDISAAWIVFALSDYDRLKHNLDPDVKVKVLHMAADDAWATGEDRSDPVLDVHFSSAGDSPVHTSMSWRDLDASSDTISSLHFQAVGSGEISVVAELLFVPFDVFQFPVYRGILVSKIIQAIDPSSNAAVGPNLKLIQAGTIVQVTLQVTTPDALPSVMLVDLLPGGLEAIDPLLENDNGSSDGYGIGTVSPGPYYERFYFYSSTFGAQETRPDRVQFLARYLGAGVHTVSYKAIAGTKGAFVLPPAKAFSTEQPELMGLSAGGGFFVQHEEVNHATVDVDLKNAVEALQDEHENPIILSDGILLPKDEMEERFGPVTTERRMLQDCEGGCPHGGICNLERGVCECYQNYRLVEGDCGEAFKNGDDFQQSIHGVNGDNDSIVIIAASAVAAVVAALGLGTFVVVKSLRSRATKVKNLKLSN
jgi:hypothetical protein